MNALISLKQLKQETENYIKTVEWWNFNCLDRKGKIYITDEK
jgi:hypothetical protein